MNVEEKLKQHLLGKEVDRVESGILYLKNGVRLELYESAYGCCAGASGRWGLPEGKIHGGITRVKFVEAEHEDEDWGESATEFVILLLHESQIAASAVGYANNGAGGRYFSALSLRVRIDNKTIDDFEVISA